MQQQLFDNGKFYKDYFERKNSKCSDRLIFIQEIAIIQHSNNAPYPTSFFAAHAPN